MTDLEIRNATTADAEGMAHLLGQLGYPVESSLVPGRLTEVTRDNRAFALLAVREQEVIGLVTAHRFCVLNRALDVAWITALVVDEPHRRQGIGRALVQAVERLARQSGCERLSVTTHEDRMGARAFYERVGLAPTGRRFGKSLVK